MKSRLKVILLVIAAFFIFLGAAYLFLVVNGKAIITSQLQDLTGRKVDIAYLGFSPPLKIQVKGLNIEGLAKADTVYISPNVFTLLVGKISLGNIKVIRPFITYEKTKPETENQDKAAAVSAVAQPKVKAKSRVRLPIIFSRLRIEDGSIDFFDHTVGQNGIKIEFRKINLTLNNSYDFGRKIITKFNLKGNIPWPQGSVDGRVEAKGWININKKDMQANVKLENIDGVYLYPYYSSWVDLESMRLEKATLALTSDIRGVNNDLTAKCHLELSDMVRAAPPEGQKQSKGEKIADLVLGIFQSAGQGKVVVNFTIKTKMDKLIKG